MIEKIQWAKNYGMATVDCLLQEMLLCNTLTSMNTIGNTLSSTTAALTNGSPPMVTTSNNGGSPPNPTTDITNGNATPAELYTNREMKNSAPNSNSNDLLHHWQALMPLGNERYHS